MVYSPRQRIMANYLNSKDPKCRVINGEDFIHHFITSNKDKDIQKKTITQKYRYFDSKKIAFKRVDEFFEVLDDLSEQKIIDVHKNPDETHNIKLILREPQQNERDFTEFHELFDEYITANFEIIDQLKFDRFIKHKYLHDLDYQDKRFKDIHVLLAKILMTITIITSIISTAIGVKQCSTPQNIIIKNKSLPQDTLNVKINNISEIKIDSLKLQKKK